MNAISPEELLGQLRGVVELLASSPSNQESWLSESNVPVSELTVELDMVWPLWEPRLRETGMVHDEDAEVLDDLKQYLLSFTNDDHVELFVPEALYESSEWKHVRELARSALDRLGHKT